MFLVIIFFLVVVMAGYKFAVQIAGNTFGLFLLSIFGCAFFSWNYIFNEVIDPTENILSELSASVHEASLPMAIVTFVVTIISGLVMLAFKNNALKVKG